MATAQSSPGISSRPTLNSIVEVLEIVADRLAASAEMGRQERFRNGRKRTTVFRSAEAMAFITIVEIGHGNAVLLHCRDDLLGFGGFDAHVVGTLADQQGPYNLAGAM